MERLRVDAHSHLRNDAMIETLRESLKMRVLMGALTDLHIAVAAAGQAVGRNKKIR